MPTFQNGDVFVGIGLGQIGWYRNDGTFVQTLNSTTGSAEMTGMAFDSAGNLYATCFQAQQVAKFDKEGNFLGLFGGPYNADPESIIFDLNGDVYVGQADGTGDILKFNSTGTLLQNFDVAREDRGSDWITLDPNQCTMYYTSEGRKILRFDVCTGIQLSDFADLTGQPGTFYALRRLPNGEFLVANQFNVLRLDTSGNIVQTYDAPGEDFFFALNLDPDGTSFWSAGITTFNVYKFDIASGEIRTQFKANVLNDVAGLAIFGEPIIPTSTTTTTTSTTSTTTTTTTTTQCPITNPQSCCVSVVEFLTQLVPPALEDTVEISSIDVKASIEGVCPEKVIVCGKVTKEITYTAVEADGTQKPGTVRVDERAFQCVIDREDADEGDEFVVVGADILCEANSFVQNMGTRPDKNDPNKTVNVFWKLFEKDLVKVCIRKA